MELTVTKVVFEFLARGADGKLIYIINSNKGCFK